MYPDLARQFYKFIHRAGKCKNKHIPLNTFRQQCEKILGMLDDAAIIETYVRYVSKIRVCPSMDFEELKIMLGKKHSRHGRLHMV